MTAVHGDGGEKPVATQIER